MGGRFHTAIEALNAKWPKKPIDAMKTAWPKKPVEAIKAAWATKPGLHWAACYAILLGYYFFFRAHRIKAILRVFASKKERTAHTKASGMMLGLLEDFIISTLLLVGLLLVDVVVGLVYNVAVKVKPAPGTRGYYALRAVVPLLRFVVALIGVALALAPFAADMLLVRTREMRFTMDFVTMYFRERAEASNLQIDPEEMRLATEAIVATVVIAIFFAALYALCVDLTRVLVKKNKQSIMVIQPIETKYDAVALESPRDDSPEMKHHTEDSVKAVVVEISADDEMTKPGATTKISTKRWFWRRRLRVVCALVCAFVAEVAITCAIVRGSATPIVSLALNTSLNELFKGVLGIHFEPPVHVKSPASSLDGSAFSVRQYLAAGTEEYTLTSEESLYRKTTGFNGPLAFNVTVDPANPPNVLVLIVESFRYMDSLYEAGETAGGAPLKKHNMSVTPNFDRWAKRGVGFTNSWSSVQTSRSVESINFAQLPYDSPARTGMTGGSADVKLAGMPHLFKQKGYETVFTTGCTLLYDQWDTFLSSHGYDTVLGDPDIKAMGMNDLNISEAEWKDGRRSLNWGVHDDVSFQVLGNLMINKTREQADRVARGEPKKPFFLNHYTISSHFTWDQTPKWYDSYPVPDFSVMYDASTDKNAMRKYHNLRFFTDLELGKFMDRMEAEGILKDTIVVIAGDHGVSPDRGFGQVLEDQVSCTRVAMAIVAEGRLGDSAGLVISDPVEHYDLLNTLADITGVPTGGFMQTGVGRSLMRQPMTKGNAPHYIWSNSPLKKKSVVRGTQRFVYDSVSAAVMLHDANADPLMTTDLFPALSDVQQREWLAIRDAGRWLNQYFKKRWDNKCLAQVSC